MDFIFMMTRADRTVVDAHAVLDIALDVGLSHIGFKDLGVPFETLQALNDRIRAAGAISHLEMVSTDPKACRLASKWAVEVGVDRLLGGVRPQETRTVVEGSSVSYLPFPGTPRGHPTELAGTPAEIEADCRAFMQSGCHGGDLLAYRSIDADPLELVRAARVGLQSGYLVCAGGVRSAAQIERLRAAGCDAFTVGSAAFEGAFAPNMGTLRAQLSAIVQAVEPSGQL